MQALFLWQPPAMGDTVGSANLCQAATSPYNCDYKSFGGGRGSAVTSTCASIAGRARGVPAASWAKPLTCATSFSIVSSKASCINKEWSCDGIVIIFH